MAKPYLKVTYRGGKVLAAYLYVNRRPGDTAARSERQTDFVIDYSGDGRLIGVEYLRAARPDPIKKGHYSYSA
jgi:uncharacterized protein YuzE